MPSIAYDDERIVFRTPRQLHRQPSIERQDVFHRPPTWPRSSKYRDGQWTSSCPKGNLDAGYMIFNRFQQRLEKLDLEEVMSKPSLTTVAEHGFRLSKRHYPTGPGRTRLGTKPRQSWTSAGAGSVKNQALSLKLAGQACRKTWRTHTGRSDTSNQLKRVRQYNSQDVFQVYANALTSLIRPAHQLPLTAPVGELQYQHEPVPRGHRGRAAAERTSTPRWHAW